MKKRSDLSLLFNINIRMVFNKKSITTIIVSFVLLIFYLIFILYNSYIPDEYIHAYREVHEIYIKEGLFVGNVVNFLLMMVFLTILLVNSDAYDSLYVSHISRGTISISKILSIIFLELVTCIIIYFLLIIPAVIVYPFYKINIDNLYILLYILIYGFIQIGITILILSFLNNNFIPMIGFIISFMLYILSFEFSSKIENFEYVLPNNFNQFDLPYLTIIFVIVSLIKYKMRYDTKNIN